MNRKSNYIRIIGLTLITSILNNVTADFTYNPFTNQTNVVWTFLWTTYTVYQPISVSDNYLIKSVNLSVVWYSGATTQTWVYISIYWSQWAYPYTGFTMCKSPYTENINCFVGSGNWRIGVTTQYVNTWDNYVRIASNQPAITWYNVFREAYDSAWIYSSWFITRTLGFNINGNYVSNSIIYKGEMPNQTQWYNSIIFVNVEAMKWFYYAEIGIIVCGLAVLCLIKWMIILQSTKKTKWEKS